MSAPPRAGAGLALAAAGSIAFSGKAIIIKLAYRHGVDAVTLIMYRMLFALPFFVVIAWWAGRGKPALERRDVVVVCGLGFSGYYLASFLDFAGLAYVSASFERLVLYLNPTLVLLLGWILFRRRVTLRQHVPPAEPAFCCNCILNYAYGGLEGRRLPAMHGPATFGEIGYQLLNQTLVYLSIVDAP